jgi:hypothetical protein
MSSPSFIGFDIETRPLPELVTKYARPYPEFDEGAVKYGNTKDPGKRAALLAEKREEHEAGRTGYWANLVARAALDPFTGAIVCIGITTDTSSPEIFCEATEAGTLRQFWQVFALADNATTKFVFWSGCGDPNKKFDIDFILTRSRILGVKIPQRVRSGRYYDNRIVDLAQEFLLNQRDRYLSLTKAADPVQGANFWQWWDGVAVGTTVAHPAQPHTAAEQRAYAAKYLCNDVLHLKYLAPRILT